VIENYRVLRDQLTKIKTIADPLATVTEVAPGQADGGCALELREGLHNAVALSGKEELVHVDACHPAALLPPLRRRVGASGVLAAPAVQPRPGIPAHQTAAMVLLQEIAGSVGAAIVIDDEMPGAGHGMEFDPFLDVGGLVLDDGRDREMDGRRRRPARPAQT